VLKLKDWPHTDDMRSAIPDHYSSCCKAFPVQAYTMRYGAYNIAKYLPSYFIPPELGPKLYSAYGMIRASHFDSSGKCVKVPTASTLAHIDSSDACNCLFYVHDTGESDDRLRAFCEYFLVDSRQIDQIIQNRKTTHKPGAIWHIFDPKKTDLIRKIIKEERQSRREKDGVKAEAISKEEDDDGSSDPIHDQMKFIDRDLLLLLRKRGIKFAAFVQCQYDAVFIPSGAVHTVININSCIKAALDFVAPERLAATMKVTYEYSQLSMAHDNHIDKIQLKSTVFHTAKEIIQSIKKNDDSDEEPIMVGDNNAEKSPSRVMDET